MGTVHRVQRRRHVERVQDGDAARLQQTGHLLVVELHTFERLGREQRTFEQPRRVRVDPHHLGPAREGRRSSARTLRYCFCPLRRARQLRGVSEEVDQRLQEHGPDQLCPEVVVDAQPGQKEHARVSESGQHVQVWEEEATLAGGKDFQVGGSHLPLAQRPVLVQNLAAAQSVDLVHAQAHPAHSCREGKDGSAVTTREFIGSRACARVGVCPCYTHARARTHARTHAHTHTHTHPPGWGWGAAYF